MKRIFQCWTKIEIENLKNEFLNTNLLEDYFVKKYNRKWRKILRKACSLNLHRDPSLIRLGQGYKLPISKEEIKRLYLSGKSGNEIAKLCGCVKSTIIKHLRNMSVKIRTSESYKVLSNNITKNTLLEDYFKNINTESKAYWLGFLYADGHINSTISGKNKLSRCFELCLKDKEHIEKFCKDVNFIGRIEKRNVKLNDKIFESYRVSINNYYFCKNLIRNGCIPQKTNTLIFPKFLRKNLIRHFIRGFFDGDGCISLNIDTNHFNIFIDSTKNILINIQKNFINYAKVNKTKITKVIRNNINSHHFSLQYSGKNNIIKILDFLYKKSIIYLDRKFYKYLKIKEYDLNVKNRY